jgi:ubiquinone/menaquinone biosynthesis C-methylase UbiE
MRALLFLFCLCLCFLACTGKKAATVNVDDEKTSWYTTGNRSYDGTGKYYMGREISQVMGHLGAGWLERSEREAEEKGSLLLEAMALKPDEVVADIGAGSGYFTFRMAPLVPKGKVLAVDIQEEMLAIMRDKKQRLGQENVELVKGGIQNPNLPQGAVDCVLMVDVYHEFSHPREMMQSIVASLKPDGRVVLVEYREEDPTVPIKPRHKMSEKQAVKEMAAVGLTLRENKTMLPRQHLMVFEVRTDE